MNNSPKTVCVVAKQTKPPKFRRLDGRCGYRELSAGAISWRRGRRQPIRLVGPQTWAIIDALENEGPAS